MGNAKRHSKRLRVAFFHPYCNDAGGGEKVLWYLVYSLFQLKNIELEVSIYQGDLIPKLSILKKAEDRFNIPIVQFIDHINIIHVPRRDLLLKPKGFATMVFQVVGCMIYALQCIVKYQPDVFFDSTGFSFAFLTVKYFLPHCQIGAYIHYPFINQMMIDHIVSNIERFNNSKIYSKSKVLTKLKYLYYKMMLKIYGLSGNRCDILFTNSTWTDRHMRSVWKKFNGDMQLRQSIKLFPPCSIKTLM